MCEINIGDAYVCKAIGVKNEVIGIVEQTYTNTVMINVVDCTTDDRPVVIELQNRLLVKKRSSASFCRRNCCCGGIKKELQRSSMLNLSNKDMMQTSVAVLFTRCRSQNV